MNDKTVEKLRMYASDLRQLAKDHDLPDLAKAFHDADAHPEFDHDPEANYLTGCIQGAADALEEPVEDLLDRLGFNWTEKLNEDEDANESENEP